MERSLQVEQLEDRWMPSPLTGASLQHATRGLSEAIAAWGFTRAGTPAYYFGSLAVANAREGLRTGNLNFCAVAASDLAWMAYYSPAGSAARWDANLAAFDEYHAFLGR